VSSACQGELPSSARVVSTFLYVSLPLPFCPEEPSCWGGILKEGGCAGGVR
jgi:hypothetical protein